MRGRTPIKPGGINDPVAQSIRAEQQRDAAPSPDEIAAERETEQQLTERLAALADAGVFLKDRDAVTDAASDHGWDDVQSAADSADDSRWQHLIKQALTYRDDQDD